MQEQKIPASHYTPDYFAWQSQDKDIQAKANVFKFEDWVKPGAKLLDFGCGTGMLLKQFGGGIGIEINPSAQAVARENGNTVYSSLSEVGDGEVDIVISNHALEHAEAPLDVVRDMYRVLKPGGRLVIVVPIDAASVAYSENDQDFHLYSWSKGNLGNLVRAAGFRVDQADQLIHTWPPKWAKIQKTFGWGAFHAACKVWGLLDWRRRQVRVVATKVWRRTSIDQAS